MTNPHDTLFRCTFSDPRHAEGLLRSVLPAAMAEAVDWTSLERSEGSFVDDALKEHRTDLLFRARVGGRAALLYLLMEHKSEPDPWTPFQLLRYIVRIWERARVESPRAKVLPMIVPIVIYHGASAWNVAPDVRELIDLGGSGTLLSDTARALAPSARYVLDDLGRLGRAELQGRTMTALAHLTLRCLQCARTHGDLIEELRYLGAAMRVVYTAPDGASALLTVLRYLLAVRDTPRRDANQIARVVREAIGPDPESKMTSFLERLEAHGGAKILIKVLVSRFGPLTPETEERVLEASYAEVHLWAERALTAKRLEDVLRADEPSPPEQR